jgi:ABC-type antimicrobial peptide transport system permease subunit
MTGLAWGSLRHRTGAFVASFLAMFLGAVILMTFASLLDTAGGAGVDATSKETLKIMATVVGGWGLVIVVFAVTSTLTLTVQQRNEEMALLKSVGATPFQLGRMIVVEAGLLALVAALLAILPAVGGGALLVSLLKRTDQLTAGVHYVFGPVGLAVGIGITLVSAVAAAVITAYKVTRMGTKEALLAAAVGNPPMGRVRVVVAWIFVVAGINCAVLTVTVFRNAGIESMATAAQATILISIGLALFAPVLLRRVTALLTAPLQGAGVAGYLTALNVRQKTRQLAAALVPIILFTGIATGVLYMQSIENSVPTFVGSDPEAVATDNAVGTLNLVVVGMIALFAAIMLVNTLIAATTHRRREFGQQRLVGSTPGQVLRMVGLEGVALAVTGVLFGSLAAVATVVPYSIARTDSAFPDTSIAIYLGVVAIAVALTLAASLGSARRAIKTPAVEAATA